MTENNTNTAPSQPSASVREVRQWRVGTFSMGLSLIALGTTVFLGRVNPELSLDNLLQFWPVILIILGLEMVVLNLFSVFRSRTFRFTYDGFSIFLVLILLFTSSAVVAVESVGLLDFAQRALHASEHRVESTKVLYPVDDTLKTLILDIEGSTTSLRTYEGNEIKVLVVYTGVFGTQEEAVTYAGEQHVGAERMGNTLAVNIYPPEHGPLYHSNVDQEVTIYIPQHLDVDFTQRGRDVLISIEDLHSAWTVRHESRYSQMDLRLGNPENAKLRIELSNNAELESNVVWDSNQSPEESRIEAVKTWGEGDYSLTLYQSDGYAVIKTK